MMPSPEEFREAYEFLARSMQPVVDAFVAFVKAAGKVFTGPPPRREGLPWWERLGTIGVDRSMTALQYVRKDLQKKFQGRKHRKFRATVLRAARRMDRIVRKGVRVQLAPRGGGAKVKVYRDGAVIGYSEDGSIRHVRFRSC